MQSLNTGKVKSFTIGMEDKAYNEAVLAREIANHLGTEHTELYITEEDAKRVIPQIPFMFGEPFADSSQIPTYLVSKMTREHVTVSLTEMAEMSCSVAILPMSRLTVSGIRCVMYLMESGSLQVTSYCILR